MNLHHMAAPQLHADRTEQLRSLRRPRRDRRSVAVPHLVPVLRWPFLQVRAAGTAPVCP